MGEFLWGIQLYNSYNNDWFLYGGWSYFGWRNVDEEESWILDIIAQIELIDWGVHSSLPKGP